jgi:response regulator RpfG family c-di-GMP phosphodiesterase
MSREEAVMELRRNVGSQFDPRVVDAFIGSLHAANPVAFPALACPIQQK